MTQLVWWLIKYCCVFKDCLFEFVGCFLAFTSPPLHNVQGSSELLFLLPFSQLDSNCD